MRLVVDYYAHVICHSSAIGCMQRGMRQKEKQMQRDLTDDCLLWSTAIRFAILPSLCMRFVLTARTHSTKLHYKTALIDFPVIAISARLCLCIIIIHSVARKPNVH